MISNQENKQSLGNRCQDDQDVGISTAIIIMSKNLKEKLDTVNEQIGNFG